MEFLTYENLIRTYKYIAIFSTFLFVVKFIIFSITASDGSEVHSDFDSVSESDASFNFFSVQSILSFLMGFGWIGLAALTEWKFSIIQTMIISIIVGLVFLYISAYLMLKIRGLNQVIKPEYEKCIGNIGKAYTTIHANSEGQVQIEINGRLSVINAINASDTEINAFEQIKVIKYENSKLYIEKNNN